MSGTPDVDTNAATTLRVKQIAGKLNAGLDKFPDKAWQFAIAANLTVTMLHYADRPYVGADSIITAGVSVGQPPSPIEYLMVFAPDSVPPQVDLYALLATFLQLHHLPLAGNVSSGTVVNAGAHIIEGRGFVGFYICHAAYFDKQTFSGLPDTRFLWLVPIFECEAKFIDGFGAEAFEAHLVSADPDLSRFDREPLFPRSSLP